MDKEENEMIEKLILDGGLEAVGVDSETGELLYSFTPKIATLMPDLYKEHMYDVNNQIMNLWIKGFVDLDLFDSDPQITLTEKCFNPDDLASLSKQEKWNLLEVMRLLKLKGWYNKYMPYWVGNKGSFGCYGYPALQIGTNKVIGCHATRDEAEKQVNEHIRSQNKINQSINQKRK